MSSAPDVLPVHGPGHGVFTVRPALPVSMFAMAPFTHVPPVHFSLPIGGQHCEGAYVASRPVAVRTPPTGWIW